MSKKSGGFNPFGGLFDFNRDGKTDLGEQWLAMKIFEECTKENEPTHDYHDYSSFSSSDDDYGWREYCDDGSEFGVDPEDYETEEEYDEALAEAKVAWRDTCDDGSEYGVDPEDYETEDEYNDALTEAKYAWRKTCEDGFEFHVDPEDYETEDEYDEALAEARVAWRDFCEDGTLYGLDPEDYETEDEYNDALSEAKVAWRKTCKDGTDYGVDPEDYETEEEYNEALSKSVCAKDYPNHRKYNAANELACIKAGFNFFSDEDEKNAVIRKCEFILNSPEIIAAQYMTHEGEFLYAQAVKENFKLPAGVDIEDEDDQVENYIDEVIQEIANENPQLALDVWLWCIDQFYPYRHFDTDETYIVNCMLYQLDSMPDEFIDALLERLKGRNDLMRILLQSCEDADQAVQYLGYKMLEKGDVESAKNVVQSFLSGKFATPDKVCSAIEGLISYSMNYDELETAERFKENLLPIFNEIQQPKVQKKLKKWATAVDSYISEMERTDDKYAYSRLYAWRANCQDGSALGVDPLDYDTESEYNEAILAEKYEWREWCADEAVEYGLSVTDYETQESFEAAVEQERNKAREEEQRQRLEQLRIRQARAKERRQEQEEKRKASIDPLAETDMTVYTFCGVVFPHGGTVYHYRTEDETLQVGDTVIVPVGDEGKEAIVEIVCVEKHRRKTAPYPVDKAKFITCKYEDECEAKIIDADHIRCPVADRAISTTECIEIMEVADEMLKERILQNYDPPIDFDEGKRALCKRCRYMSREVQEVGGIKISTKQLQLLKKYGVDFSEDINDILETLDAKITEIGFDSNYELNNTGRKLQRLYDALYEQN